MRFGDGEFHVLEYFIRCSISSTSSLYSCIIRLHSLSYFSKYSSRVRAFSSRNAASSFSASSFSGFSSSVFRIRSSSSMPEISSIFSFMIQSRNSCVSSLFVVSKPTGNFHPAYPSNMASILTSLSGLLISGIPSHSLSTSFSR